MHLFRCTALSLLAAASLSISAVAQDKQDKKDKKDTDPPKSGQTDKDANKTKGVIKKPKKDDPVTAKDAAIVAVDKFLKKKVSTKRADWKTTMPAPPELKFAAGHDYLWYVETDKGLMVVRLFWQTAPKHVASTIYLSRAGFYDDLQFPRILKGFMAQGGSPLNSTAGNAGYTLDGEFDEPRKHDAPGMLSAANSGAANSDGSQFFLTFAPATHLDGKHTVYGQVIEGLPVLEALDACGVEKDGDAMPEKPKIVTTWIQVTRLPTEK